MKCFLSPLVEVGTFAFLATELDDAAESARGGVADQPKTTATVGAPHSSPILTATEKEASRVNFGLAKAGARSQERQASAAT
jgi:hypothetical protein